MDKQQLKIILDKYIEGTCSEEELQVFEQWYKTLDEYSKENIPDEYFGNESEYSIKMLQDFLSLKAKNKIQKTKRINLYFKVAVAAIIILGIGTGIFWKLYRVSRSKQTITVVRNDAAPGHDGAVLTLADGSEVMLDSTASGAVAQQAGVQVINAKGQLVYNENSTAATTQITYNTLTTPKARQYKLVLPDGTKVWLNSASSIHYPVAFSGKERIVEITGEAYFEVMHNAAIPFKVITAGNTIEDIGTEFDINAYEDESNTKTTLLQGAVKVNGTLLHPGEEASISKQSGAIAVSKADTDDAIAWVNGQLSLECDNIQTLLRRIGRWYNVDIKYDGSLPNTALFGSVSRNVYLSQVLKALAAYGVNARQQGNTVIVSAK
ncbi:MAG: FecR domain-containing protein [Arachidicoccus sp.]|nr:FecR domain-containing protein [Arachidicoccus sp.]